MMDSNKSNRLVFIRRVLMSILMMLIVFTAIFNVLMRKYFIGELHDQLKTNTQNLSSYVDNYFDQHAIIVKQLSGNSQIVSKVKSLEDDPEISIKNVSQLIKDSNAVPDNMGFSWVGINALNKIIYPEGYAVLASDYQYDQRPWYKTMIKNPDIVSVSEPYIEVADYNEVVTLVTPIYDDKKIIGNIGMDIQLEQLKEFVSTFQLGNEGVAALVTEAGYVLSQNYDREITENHVFKTRRYPYDEINNIYLDGKRVILCYTETKFHNWYLVTYMPISEINASLDFISLLTGLTIVLVVLVMMSLNHLIRLYNSNQVLSDLNTELNEKEKLLLKKQNQIEENALVLQLRNEELEAAYQQLTAFDEELKAQYDETSVYAKGLETLKRQFDLAVDYTHSAVWEYDIKNEKLSIVYGFRENNNDLKASGNDPMVINEMIYHEDRKAFWEALHNHIIGDSEEIHHQLRIYNSSKEIEWWLVSGKKDVSSDFISGILVDISKMKDQEEAVRKLAFVDPLTNLPNRRQFIERLNESLSNERKGAVVLLDLDNFKDINDTLGHVYGDQILRVVAKRLEKLTEKDLFISRFGGDEFLVLIENCVDKETLNKIMKDLIKRVGENIIIGHHDNEIGVSIGITRYPKDSTSVDQLIMNADVAMYHVKKTGKNSFVYFDDKMSTVLQDKTNIEKILDHAIKNDDFRLVLQPQIEPSTGRVKCCEALVRLKYDSITPGEFIPIAETSHRIIDIGRWVLKEVVSLLSKWQSENRRVKPISINFSPKQLHDHDFISYFQELVKTYKVEPKLIHFEITESIMLNHEKASIEFMKAIQTFGCKIALDDFGTGYSSFSYLTYLPVDYIKLDKSLIDRFVEVQNINVIKRLIQLAQELNLKVIAEGVETFMQVELLNRISCDLIQGYYYSKPIAIEEYEKIMDHKFE